MHSILSILLKLILVCVITGVFTAAIAVRPNRKGPMTKGTLALCIIVGIAISAVLLATQSLYQTQTGI